MTNRRFLIGAAVLAFAVVLVAPLAVVFVEALRRGFGAFAEAIAEPDALASMRLTLLVAAISVPANVLFGLAAAWLVTRFQFRGKRLLVSLIELPLSVSPVVSGLVFVLLFGAQGLLGPRLEAEGIQVIFALPGLVLATVFVTFPLVARTLIPVMEAQGIVEEEAALALGASGFQIFRRVTLPKIRWALLTGVLLCNARAMGEFGAVSVVSGHIRGETNTMPLHIESLFNEYQMQSAFAVASLLAALAVVTLAVKAVVERRGLQEASS